MRQVYNNSNVLYNSKFYIIVIYAVERVDTIDVKIDIRNKYAYVISIT